MGSQRVLIQNYQTSKASSKLILNSSFLSTQNVVAYLFTLFLTGCISRICLTHSHSSLSVEDTFQIPNQIPAEYSLELDRQCSGISILQHHHMVPELICSSTLGPGASLLSLLYSYHQRVNQVFLEHSHCKIVTGEQ